MQMFLEVDLARNALFILVGSHALLLLRRLYAVRQSGGKFLEPFHITRGVFYIHAALVFGKRAIPLSEIECVVLHFARGKGGGRYIVNIERIQGIGKALVIGQSRGTEELIRRMKRELQKAGIKIYDRS